MRVRAPRSGPPDRVLQALQGDMTRGASPGVCGFYGLAESEGLGCRSLWGGTRGSRQPGRAIQRTAVRPLLGNGDERGVVERSGRTSHQACDWMPPTDSERSAVRTNAAPTTDRLPLRGDIHGNGDPRADAGRGNSGFSSRAGK